ncbi:MAG: hypothetical protein RSH24_06055, partial [Flavobacterium sp.]
LAFLAALSFSVLTAWLVFSFLGSVIGVAAIVVFSSDFAAGVNTFFADAFRTAGFGVVVAADFTTALAGAFAVGVAAAFVTEAAGALVVVGFDAAGFATVGFAAVVFAGAALRTGAFLTGVFSVFAFSATGLTASGFTESIFSGVLSSGLFSILNALLGKFIVSNVTKLLIHS